MSTLHERFQASNQFHKTKITRDWGKASQSSNKIGDDHC
jgi:hypothetical protein